MKRRNTEERVNDTGDSVRKSNYLSLKSQKNRK